MAKDAHGNELKIGDRVQVKGVIVSTYPEQTNPQHTAIVIHVDHPVFEDSPDHSFSAGVAEKITAATT